MEEETKPVHHQRISRQADHPHTNGRKPESGYYMALAFVREKQSEGDCEVLRCDKEICGTMTNE
jgi:hypothetical protein